MGVVPASYPIPILRSTVAELRRALESFRERQRSRFFIWVEELQSGLTIDLDGHQSMPAGGLYHLLLATYCVAEAAAGRVDLNQSVTYEPGDRTTGLGRMQQASFGDRFTLLQLCEYALVDGDLTAGRLLRKALDPAAIQKWAAAEALGGFEAEQLSPWQAGALLKLVMRLAESGAARGSMLLEWLLSTRNMNWTPRHLPWSAPTAHLTGALATHLHDAGIVFLAKGSYLLAVMSDLGADPRMGVGIENLAQVGGIVYRHLRLVEGMLGRVVSCGKRLALPQPVALLDGRPTLDATSLATALGARLESDRLTGSLTLTRGLLRVTVAPGNSVLSGTAGERPLPFAPFLFEGEMILPLVPVAAALGRRLDWDNERNIAHLHD